MKQITKNEFLKIISKAVGKEVEEFTEKTGGGTAGIAITLLGVSIGAKIMDILFDDEEEIEIVTDKE